MCIIFSTPFPPQEGIGTYVGNLASELSNRGFEVTLVTRNRRLTYSYANWNGIDVHLLPFAPIYPFHLALHGRFVRQWLDRRSESFDILNVHMPLCPFFSTNLPTVVTFHTPMFFDAKSMERTTLGSLGRMGLVMATTLPTELRWLRSNARVASVSTFVANELAKYPGCPARITTVGNGVDSRLLEIPPSFREDGSILFVGRLDYRKGLFDLLQAMSILKQSNGATTLRICGKGPLLRKLLEEVRLLKLEKSVKMLGFVSEVELLKLYQKSSIFVLPSRYEGLPTVLLESMACGLAVVASSIGPNREVLSHGVDGLLVPPGSPVALADAMRLLLKDRTLARKLGSAARKKVKENFLWEHVAERYVKVLGQRI